MVDIAHMAILNGLAGPSQNGEAWVRAASTVLCIPIVNGSLAMFAQSIVRL
jgi:hypothetical protein